jgi:hypothetical protein
VPILSKQDWFRSNRPDSPDRAMVCLCKLAAVSDDCAPQIEDRQYAELGRVAESGLRHSTRNRAWGNPPWVRIPPLPPVFLNVAAREDPNQCHIGGASERDRSLNCLDFPLRAKISENVTILGLPRSLSLLHIVCPQGRLRYYLLLTGIHRLLAPLFTIIRTLFRTSTLPHRHDSTKTRNSPSLT